ncbi:hypothetical protein [Jeotgalibacillus soli]|uniref:DUF4025 domain-containing protein n=1 Tax=Jeotgalibacillus soli TaxID=889306 RepID=A0A0C2W659_9BACL|nr:hypothetical protein [Jeotgalibacillus soli]KIL52051.1 hypothetical protein KP78_04210 [Jeotgalibacillus soli]
MERSRNNKEKSITEQQIQDSFQDGTVDTKKANTGSVKGNKKVDGPNYPST